MLRSLSILSLLGAGLSLMACEKDERTASTDADVQSGAAQAMAASAAFSTASTHANAAAEQNGALHGLQDPAPDVQGRTCGTTTFVPSPLTFFPATLTLDYGSACTDAWGHQLGGRLTATFNGLLGRRGTGVTLGFSDFSVDGKRLSGKYRIANTGLDAEGRQTFRHEITDGELTYADGRKIGYSEAVTSVRVAGQQTTFFTSGAAGLADDVWADTRTATVDAADGNRYFVTTSTALRRPATCGKVVAGRYEITSNGLSGVGTLDFGGGECDGEATLTYAGQTYVVQH